MALRFGVEEEFLVVDPASRAVVAEAEAVLTRARVRLGDRVGGEITKLQVETRTDPCHSVAELHAQVVHARQVLAECAAGAGLRVIASASPVLGQSVPPPMVEGPRPEKGTATFRALHDDLAICALHVHVEMADRERAVLASNHLRPHLPALIALTANSPYWAERDTGYASWRTMTWQRWPVAGPPPYFTSLAHHDEILDILSGTGALVDHATIFWDIRPSARLPTLEVRVSDVAITAEETALVAALVRALTARALRAVDAGDPGPVVPAELMRLAYWRAARDGLAGAGIDPHTGRPLPAADLARRLLRLAEPDLAEAGDLDRVTESLDRLIGHGDGATRQRRVAASGAGPAGVVDQLIAWTAPGRTADVGSTNA